LQHQYLYPGTDSANIIVSSNNWFIVGGPGDDALQAFGGYNVLDGGTGSNFLTGGSGSDTFFIHHPNSGADSWTTVNGFHDGDDVTVFGVVPTTDIEFVDDQGAMDFSGLTLHITSPNGPIESLTLTGYSTSDLGAGHLVLQFGDESDGTPFLHIVGT
jgi:serralysin